MDDVGGDTAVTVKGVANFDSFVGGCGERVKQICIAIRDANKTRMTETCAKSCAERTTCKSREVVAS